MDHIDDLIEKVNAQKESVARAETEAMYLEVRDQIAKHFASSSDPLEIRMASQDVSTKMQQMLKARLAGVVVTPTSKPTTVSGTSALSLQITKV